MNFNSNNSDEEVYSSVSLDMSALDKLDEITQRLTMDALNTADSAGTSTQNSINCEHTDHVHTRKKRSGSDGPILSNNEEMKYRQKLFPDSEKVLKEKIRCTACGTSLLKHVMKGRGLYFHPILQVLVCQDCREFYGDGDFPVDDDGSDTYCRWCAQGGSLYCCSACSYVFCKTCVRRNFKKSMLDEIEEADWKCFVCNPEALWKHRAICWASREHTEGVTKNDSDSETSDDEQQQGKRRSGLRNVNPKGNQKSRVKKKRIITIKKDSDDETGSDNDEADKRKVQKMKDKDREKRKDKEKQKDREKERHRVADRDHHKEKRREESNHKELGKDKDVEKQKEKIKTKDRERDGEKGKVVKEVSNKEKDKKSSSKEKNRKSSSVGEDVSKTKEKVYSSKKDSHRRHTENSIKDMKEAKVAKLHEEGENKPANLDDSFLISGSEVDKMDNQENAKSLIDDDDDSRKVAAMKKACHLLENLTKEAHHICNSSAKKSDQFHIWISTKNKNTHKHFPTNPSKLGKMIASFKKILRGVYEKTEELQNKVAEVEKEWKDVLEPSNNSKEPPENVENMEESQINEGEEKEKDGTSITLKPADNDENSEQISEGGGKKEQTMKTADIEDLSKLNEKSNECLNEKSEKVKVMETDKGEAGVCESEEEKVDKVGDLEDNVDHNDHMSETEKILTKSPAKEFDSSPEKATNRKSWIDDSNNSLVDDEEVEGNDRLVIEESINETDEEVVPKSTNKDINDKSEEEAMEVNESVEKVVEDEQNESSKAVPDLNSINNTSVDIFDDEEQSPTNIPLLESDDEDENEDKVPEKDVFHADIDKDDDLDKDGENNQDNVDKSEALNNDRLQEKEMSDVEHEDHQNPHNQDNVDKSEALNNDRLQEKEMSDVEHEGHQNPHNQDNVDKSEALNNDRLQEKEMSDVEHEGHQNPDSKTKEVDDGTNVDPIENKKGDKSTKLRIKKENLDEENDVIPSKKDRDAKMEFLLDTSLSSGESEDEEAEHKKKRIKKKTKYPTESSDSDEDSSVNQRVTKGKKSCSGGLDEDISDSELVSKFDDEKLKAGCFVHLKKMENCDNPVTSEPKHNKNVNKKDKIERAINRLGNLKSLDKTSSKNSDDESNNKKSKERKKESKSKKEKKSDEDEKIMSDEDLPPLSDDSNMDAIENPKISDDEKDTEMNEIAKKFLCDSSPSDFDLSDNDDDKDKKKEKEKPEKTSKKDKSDEEDKKKKAKIGSDESSSDDFDFDKSKKAWKNDKLLREKLNETDSDEKEKKWKAKKEKESKLQSDSEDEAESKIVKTRKLRKRRLASSSGSESVKLSSDPSGSDSSDFDEKKKRKRKAKSDTSESSDSKKKKKLKRRRIKTLDSDSKSSGNEEEKEETPNKGRKNIRKVLKGEKLGEETKAAAKDEEERRKRIAERQKLYNELFTDSRNLETLDKLVLDFDPETKKELVYVDPVLVKKLKPHQAEGVKFMWEACFESLKRMETEKGSGCILAHCMGLGKTLQVITLVHTLLSNPKTKVDTVLVICPVNTVLNWVNEFQIWLKDCGTGKDVEVFEISKYKVNVERMYQLKDWQADGGVMVIGYDMYRNLVTPGKRVRKKVQEVFQSTLADPGPDLVICDEGHLLKNLSSALSKAVNAIKTSRRIVLTGTPLQNNLKEYHCMIQFVKPNLLGTYKEFLNRFVNPISNGQCADSTPHDVRVMKRRAHVLHKMLEGCVQRCDYSVLTPFLPPKHEYVICIRLTELQSKLYVYYLENLAQKSGGTNLFNDFQNLQRIWTHPRVLKMSQERVEKKKLMQSDSEGSLRDFVVDDDDESDTTTPSSDSSDNKVRKKRKKMKRSCKNGNSSSSESSDVVCLSDENKDKNSKENGSNDEDASAEKKEWWEEYVEPEDHEKIIHSGKLMLLLEILQKCELIGDKVLLFSQSLYSLNLIEYFLEQIDEETQKLGTEDSTEETESEENKFKFIGSWAKGLDYFRIDGSVSGENRSLWCKEFNKELNTRARLFLISTRAGGMGINLVGANRVILFDASWNPSSDLQSIFRIYRFGQKKPCYVYRFLAQGTMEEKIYNRQVTKLSLASRVLDEHQIERHFNFEDLQELYAYDPTVKSRKATPLLPKDRLLAELLQKYSDLIDNYHEHDSLLENKAEEELTEEERKAAWEDFENDKKEKLPDNNLLMGALKGLNQMFPGQVDASGNPIHMYPGQIPEIPGLREAIMQKFPNATESQLSYELRLATSRISQYFSQTNQQQMFNHMATQNQIRGPMYGGMMQQMHQHQQMPQQLPHQAAYMQASYGLQNYYHNPLIPSSSTNRSQMLLPQVPNSGSHYVPRVMDNLQQQLMMQQQKARSTMQLPVQKAPEENTLNQPVKLKIRNDLMPGTIEIEDDSDIIIESEKIK